MPITIQQFHSDFKTADEFNQILLLDNFYSTVEIDTGIFDETLLFDAYRSAGTNFIKRGLLSIIGDLTLIGTISNSYATTALFYKILSNSSDSFLIVLTLKYLSFSDVVKDQGLSSKILLLSEQDDSDIASEAMFCLGVTDMKNIGPTDNPEIFLKSLHKAREKFNACNGFAENRTDATFYIATIDFLLSLTRMERSGIEANWSLMKTSLLTRCLYETQSRNLQLEYFVYDFLNHFKTKVDTISSVNNWLSFRTDILQLFSIDTVTRQLLFSQNKESVIGNRLFKSITDKISDQFIVSNFSQERGRLESLTTEYNNGDEKTFITSLLDTVIKNNTQIDAINIKLLSTLISLYGQENGNLIYSKVDNSVTATGIMETVQRLNIPIPKDIGYKTGTPVGHEVYSNLKREIESFLPNYSDEKMEIYFRIVEELIRYSRRTISDSSKADFLFLYASKDGGSGQKAKEGDLQHNMYDMLRLTSVGYGFDLEKAKFADGGRVDLVFKVDLMTIPIEFKKTLIAPTVAQIEEWYIAQAQTYTAAYDQLGLFVLLDLSTKNVSPNFRDWFHVHHLSPSTNMSVKHPDYIVSIVIPGNKLLPSSKSVYK